MRKWNSERVVAAIARAKLTHEEVAKQLAMSKQSFSNYIRGRNPSLFFLEDIAEILSKVEGSTIEVEDLLVRRSAAKKSA